MLNTNTYDLFDNFFGNNFFTQTRSSSQMKTDVTEKDGNYLLNIEMPGYKKEDIHAELKSPQNMRPMMSQRMTRAM